MGRFRGADTGTDRKVDGQQDFKQTTGREDTYCSVKTKGTLVPKLPGYSVCPV